VELLAHYISEGKIKPKEAVNTTVTYHDPCRLGRQLKVFDEPREIISSIPKVNFVEMERNRIWSWCCGSGASVVSTAEPKFAEWTAGKRLQEVKDTGAETLITACPWCIQNLKGSAKEEKMEIEILDISEFISRSVGIDI
jgi:heterodisulfide reductase subunit D